MQVGGTIQAAPLGFLGVMAGLVRPLYPPPRAGEGREGERRGRLRQSPDQVRDGHGGGELIQPCWELLCEIVGAWRPATGRPAAGLVPRLSRTHKRRIDQMLDQEPGLQLIGSDHVGDNEIVCSVIS